MTVTSSPVRRYPRRHLLLFLLLACSTASAATEPILPPEIPWDGKSRSLVVAADDPWITPCEQSGLLRTPRYDETVAWLRRLVEAAPELQMISLGRSGEGREIWMVIASADRAFTPEALRVTGKPTILAHAGIHSGEIDGKDAGMMLLRDLTVRGTKRELLDAANLLFVPILSVDGHERFSRYGRINQRGPEEMGWRSNARNLNINRDFAKLDTPEARAIVAALITWKPDLYLDLHVTDGIDYQYDITWGYHGPHGYSPSIARWLDAQLTPALTRELEEWGHIPGPLVFAVDRTDLDKGIVSWTAGPRFSNGYADLRHLPMVLLENHSLKPYPQRVLGTYVWLETTMRVVGAHFEELRRAVEQDRARRPEEVPLAWKRSEDEPARIEFLGVEQRLIPSRITGETRVEYTGQPVTLDIPLVVWSEPAETATRPRAYWIPPAWDDVIARLDLHGIRMQRIDTERELDAEIYRLVDPALEPEPYEGHARVKGSAVRERRRVKLPAGSVRISTDQPLGDLAVVLLEPDSPDSFYRWGFFLEVLTRTEYAEAYALEPIAEGMMDADPDLAAAFREKLVSDPEFAADPDARRMWFYRRTPYFDERYRIYPVVREP